MVDTDLKHEYEDEIELMDILLVIWRWKFFITGIVVLTIISTVIYVYAVPEIYKCSMIIKSAVVEQSELSKKVIIASSTDIKGAIGSKPLNDQVIDSLKLYKKDLYKGGLFFNVTSNKKTNLIKVEYYGYKPAQGVEILNSLVSFLDEYFQPQINDFIEQKILKISEVDIQIKNHKNQLRRAAKDKADQINFILKTAEYYKIEKANLEETRVEIIERIKSIEKQKESVEKKYDVLIGKAKQHKNMQDSTIFFFNNILFLESKLDRIQQEAYNLQMLLLKNNNKINQNFIKHEKFFNQKINVQNDSLIYKEKIDLLISGLENDKKLQQIDLQKITFAVETIKSPEFLPNPVKPKKKLIIFLSFASSLFLSIFCTFIIEYFRKYNKRMGIDN